VAGGGDETSDTEHGDVEHGDVEHGDVEHGDVETSERPGEGTDARLVATGDDGGVLCADGLGDQRSGGGG